ncbi:Galanin receptor type 3 [Orchesella cincta]|uniref:Galanin receptor type 3 n=1 Tax=Orchesella cincta TaxID=48709 RepID=A0A1D2M2D8_ORCCI|nr:Galanin receptor type 3 [Orchesella cincta]
MTTNGSSLFIHLGDEETEYIFDRGEVRAIFLVLYSIVFCSCFFGNLMVILVVTLHWRMRSITNFCLANLAFADLCVGIFCVYQNIVTYLMDSWIFGEFMCKMYHFINSLSTTASVLILVVICIERYLAIIHPMTCKQMMTLTRLRITIICVWILSAAISSPRFYYFTTISYPLPNGQEEILCVPNRTKYDSKILDMISMTVLFIIPLLIISVLYTQIGVVLWKTSTTKMSATSGSMENSSSGSASYYQEADSIIQTFDLTLLPVPIPHRQQSCYKNHHVKLSPTTNHVKRDVCHSSVKKPAYCSSELFCNYSEKHPHKVQSVVSLSQQNSINHSVQVHNYFNKSEETSLNHCCAQTPNHLTTNGDCSEQNQTGFNAKDRRVNEDESTSPKSTCCGSARKRCLKLSRKHGSDTQKEVTFSTPPSPFSSFDARSSKTDPIVLVKFEKKQKKYKKGRRDQCTILMNTKNLHSNSCQCGNETFTRLGGKSENTIGSQCDFCANNYSSIESSVSSNACKCPCSYEEAAAAGASFPSQTSRQPALKKIRRLRVVKSSKYGSVALQSRRKIVRMLIVVVLAFAVCHLPFHARKIWQYMSSSYQGGSVFSQVFTPLTFLIMYANSGINPLLYAFMSKKFRTSFSDLLCCKMRKSLRISRNASVRSTHVVALSHGG